MTTDTTAPDLSDVQSGLEGVVAFATEIAEPDSLGQVSGWGWGLGYVGGLASLGACLG